MRGRAALALALALLPLAPSRAHADDAAILAAAARRWAAAAELHKQFDKLLAAERESVVKLIGEIGTTDDTKALAGLVVPPALDALNGGSPALDAADAGKKLAAWRRTWAPKWGKLVKLAGQVKRADFAHRFARLALLRDADQPDARALLGHVKVQGAWLGPLAVAKARAGQIWSPAAGWVAKADLPRVIAGELPYEGRWLPVSEVSVKRADWETAWSFEIEGWRVRTSAAQSEWPLMRALLIDASGIARELFGHLFDCSSLRPTDALVFASTEQYRTHVDRTHSGDSSYRSLLGFYEGSDHALHVAWDGAGSSRAYTIATLVHEAIHAVLGESEKVDGVVPGNRSASFAEESVALLSEELSNSVGIEAGPAESLWTVPPERGLIAGGRLSLREAVSAAPLAHPDQLKLYAHARAAARFLYGHPDPRRFEALKEYVALQHKNQAHPDLFPKLCGTTWEQLEADWNAFCDELVKNPNHGRPEPLKWPR